MSCLLTHLQDILDVHSQVHARIPTSCSQETQADFNDRQGFTGIAVGLQLSTDATDG